jgi:hypothetical protein
MSEPAQSGPGKQTKAASARKSRKKPTGKSEPAVPTEPPEHVNEADQALLMNTVQPASGFLLARLVSPQDRARIGFSKSSKAYQAAALLQVLRVHNSDDHTSARARPGDLVFASLEEIAPLLGTMLFLVPLTHLQGHISTGDDTEVSKPFGFG